MRCNKRGLIISTPSLIMHFLVTTLSPPIHKHLNTSHGQSETNAKDISKMYFLCFFLICPSFLISTVSSSKIYPYHQITIVTYALLFSTPECSYYVEIEKGLFTLPFRLASEILVFYTHLCPHCYHLVIVYLSHCLWINPVEPSVLNHTAKISLWVI